MNIFQAAKLLGVESKRFTVYSNITDPSVVFIRLDGDEEGLSNVIREAGGLCLQTAVKFHESLELIWSSEEKLRRMGVDDEEFDRARAYVARVYGSVGVYDV